MKKIIPALMAVAVMSIGLTACGDDEECEGAGLSSGVGIMSMTDGSSGGGGSGSSKSGGGGGKSTSKGGGSPNSKPSSPKGTKVDFDDDCDD